MGNNRLQTHIYNPKSNTVGLTELDVLRTGWKTEFRGLNRKPEGPSIIPLLISFLFFLAPPHLTTTVSKLNVFP